MVQKKETVGGMDILCQNEIAELALKAWKKSIKFSSMLRENKVGEELSLFTVPVFSPVFLQIHVNQCNIVKPGFNESSITVRSEPLVLTIAGIYNILNIRQIDWLSLNRTGMLTINRN